MSEAIFQNYIKERLSLEDVVDEIVAFVKQKPEIFYKIIVGSDSNSSERPDLVTAVTVWRVGNGGIHFWTYGREQSFATMRERVWAEAARSITLAQELRSRLKDALGEGFFWDGNEVHVDVGREGATAGLVDGIVGMIRGYRFKPVIKPHAFGASVVADRHT